MDMLSSTLWWSVCVLGCGHIVISKNKLSDNVKFNKGREI